MAEGIFFKSEGHKTRFLETISRLGKVYDGKLDPEYGAALYILTADASTWNNLGQYASSDGINFEELVQETDLGGSGYQALICLAGNLFNDGRTKVNPVNLMGLADGNFEIAMSSFRIRRENWPVEDIAKEIHTVQGGEE